MSAIRIMSTENAGPGYRIWAVDNVIYGPVELPVLVNWVKEERVTADTWIHSDDLDHWTKASKVPELSMFFAKRSANNTAASTLADQRPAIGGLKAGSLRRMKIFAGMSDGELEKFLDFIEIQTVAPWTTIVKQGSPGDAMFLILEGEVRVRLLIGGKETILATLPHGEFFGEISLFDHGSRSADVVTNKDTILLKITAFSFQKLVTEAPALASPFLFAIGKTLTARIRADNKRFQDSINMARNVARQ
jgi:hypothetical protein